MGFISASSSLRGSCAAGAILVAIATPAAAQAAAPFSVPAMPLAGALEEIARRTGTPVHFDPDAVAGARSAPVDGARTALQAVHAAIRDMRGLSVAVGKDGSLDVANDILVDAHRDEAETSVLVRQASTSDRSGQSLREQARNTQVISSKLIADQQDLTLLDALRNAGGVVLNTGDIQGGNSYSVRGFSSDGLVNGLPGTSSTGVPAGASEPIAAIERVEVLKGPDAVLGGADNLGGAVNIVYKKPSADPLLEAQVDTGSYGLRRFTIDANDAVTSDGHLSARLIATASATDHNFGGYRGGVDDLILPELRFKDAHTDIVVGYASAKTITGLNPFAPVNPATNLPYELPIAQPLFARDQYIRVDNDQVFVNAERKVGDWLDLVARFQHQHTSLLLNMYSVLAILDPSGVALLDDGASRQSGDTNAVDAFARFHFGTLGVKHALVAGYNYVDGSTLASSASDEAVFPYQFVGNPTPPTPIAPADTLSYLSGSRQQSFYVQDLVSFWKLHLLGAVRHTEYSTYGFLYFINTAPDPYRKGATTPNVGIVLDVTPSVSLFANYLRGFAPSFARTFSGALLPNIETRNVEGGVKLDLFGKRMTVNASYFDLKQSNILVPDPAHAGYNLPGPGQEGRGIDLNAIGTILPGWTVQASLTRTDYSFLTDTYGTVVQSAPKLQYSVYSSYERKIADKTTLGFAAGVYGRSRAAVDTNGGYYVPAANQIDLNAILRWRGLTANIGVRNVFDRRNYATSFTSSYIPYGEPRNWRLTIGYRFR